MKQVVGLDAARKALRRVSLESQPMSPRMASRHRELFGEALSPEQAVDRIIHDVQTQGDRAVLDYTRSIDGIELRALRLDEAAIALARREVDPDLASALELAAERVRAFHRACMPKSWFDPNTGLGQQFGPLDTVGVYVPGGTASYPSTVLHTVIPAKVAGVRSVVMASPPQRDGRIGMVALAAAAIAGADIVVPVGGAQAIAALAMGTETIPKVDKIVGPGNMFVTIAKRKLFGLVGIDGLHGPTETMLIADDSADIELCAADLLAQAEHDTLATPLLLSVSERLYQGLPDEIARQVSSLERADIARISLQERGVLALLQTIEEAIGLANEFAPEHLCLLVKDPWRYAGAVRHAGGLFLGEHSPEVLGDYVAGPSHTMPTGGTARFSSALGVHDFLKVTSMIGLSADEAARLCGPAARIARAEGLTAHARAAELRAAGEPGRPDRK